MGAIRGCIFDLDGVIVDTAHYHFLAWKRLAAGLNYQLTPADNERLKGVSRLKSLEIVLQLAGISMSAEEMERLADQKNAWFREYVAEMKPDEIFPGVTALIRELRGAGIKVGLASSSKNAREVIRLLGIADEFDAIVEGNMIAHTKPHPEIFLKTAELLGVAPEACVVVEDAEAGVEAALAAGMKCIGIGSPAALAKADAVFPKTGDINLSTLTGL